jgi:hypothetical protein
MTLRDQINDIKELADANQKAAEDLGEILRIELDAIWEAVDLLADQIEAAPQRPSSST